MNILKHWTSASILTTLLFATTPVGAQNNKNKQQGSKKSGVYKAPAVTGTVYNADTAFAAPTPKKGRPKKTSPVSRK